MLSIALNEVGIREVETNKVKYNTWYYGREVSGSSYAWCMVFQAWVANQAGVLNTYVPKTASCDECKSWMSQKGWYRVSAAFGGTYVPQAGDIVFFSGNHIQSDSTHVGLVVSVSGGTLNTVEGNSSDSVAVRNYQLTSNYIIGYGSIGAEPASESYDSVSSGNSNSVSYSSGTLNKVSAGKLSSSQAITKKHTTGITVSHPYAKVAIYTEKGLISIRQSLLVSDNHLDLDILSIITKRDMNQDCPTFTLNLSWQREWYDKIGSNDLIIIKMCRPPEKNAVVFLGLVDDVRKSTNYDSNKPTRAISVTGRGWGKAMVRFEVGTVTELNAVGNSLGFMSNSIDSFSGCPPATVANGIIDFFVGKGCNYTFANGKSYMSYFKRNFKISNANEKLTDSTSFLSYQGSLWNLLKEVNNAPFNEMFWEIYNDNPTLVFRPTPFNETDWSSLERITIKDLDIVSEDVGVSDTETYTIFKVNTEEFVGDTSQLYLPVWYKPYYEKYGLARLEVSTKYLEMNDSSDAYDKMLNLANWNILNNTMENGTLTVKGSNLYKVGSRVIVESTGVEYYVEGVQHNYTFFQGWTTTLSVTRGIIPDKRYARPWNACEIMTEDDFIHIFNQSGGTFSTSSSGSNNTSSGNNSGGASYSYDANGANGYVPSGNYTKEDYDYMVATISGEAWVSEYMDCLGVAWCIMNRVHSGSFPNTVKGVVTQKSQFSGYSAKNIGIAKTQYVAQAAIKALNGQDNPIGNRLYFKSQSYYKKYASSSNWSNPITLTSHGNTYHN